MFTSRSTEGSLLHAALDVVLLVRHRDLADQRHRAVVDLRADAVEDREVRILQHLPLHITEDLKIFFCPVAPADVATASTTSAVATSLANMMFLRLCLEAC